MPDDLGSAILEIARAHGDRPALWAKGEQLTYSELLGSALRLAASLGQLGIRSGDRVAIYSERSTTPYVAILGILLAGAAYVPLNVRYPIERNRKIVADSGAKVVLCSDAQSELAQTVINGLSNVAVLTDVDAQATPPIRPDERMRAGDLAYVFFTSGTTGVPKGVPISHSNVLAYLAGLRTFAETTPQDRVMQVVDLTFDLSVHDIFVAWTSGACLYSIPENGTLLASRFVEEHEGTHWLSVPSAAALVKQSGLLTPGCMPSLRYTFFCGEALPGRVAESWAAAAPNSAVFNIYGPTEATIAFTAFRYQPGQAEPPAVVSLGEPYPGQEVALFDEARQPVSGGTGEICLSGTQVSQGYWNAPEITAERFFEAAGKRWYRTGDLGRYVPGEGYAYLGRVDRQVKIRGYRVELQEIEAAVCKVTGCDMAAVVPWPLDTSGAALGCVAYVLAKEVDGEVTERLKALLPDYMIPSRVTALAELPLNANGKIDHRAIAALLAQSETGARSA